MTSASLTETLSELNALCQFFSDAETGLKKGQIVDLTGIDARVAAVCQTVQQAIPEQQKEFLPELTVLINLLNIYEQSLRTAQSSADEPVGQNQEQGHAAT